MSWTRLLSENRVTREPSSKAELDNLRSIVQRCLSDVKATGLSDEQRFIIAYDAARTLSLMIVRACGYRPRRAGYHYYTFRALDAADPVFAKTVAYFDACRTLRNESEYDYAGAITKDDADELERTVVRFRQEVSDWIIAKFPDLGQGGRSG